MRGRVALVTVSRVICTMHDIRRVRIDGVIQTNHKGRDGAISIVFVPCSNFCFFLSHSFSMIDL